MANFDAKAIITTPNYSRINLTYESIGTLQMGIGTPVLHKVILPGDDFRVSIDQIMRLAPLATPVFDDVSLHFRAFFVPNRILDPRWKEFITAGIGLYGGSDGDIEPLSFTVRSLVSAFDEIRDNLVTNVQTYAAGIGGLADWLNFHFAVYDPESGRPQNRTTIEDLTYDNTPAATFSILPFLGYQKIFDDWYRNERLQSERLPDIISRFQGSLNERVWDENYEFGGVPSAVNPFALWRANYGKDRYTTGLPEPVVGGDVAAISGNASVFADSPVNGQSDTNNVGKLYSSSSSDALTVVNGRLSNSPLLVSLASAAENTVRNLKAAFKMYDFFMKDTYGGNRYVEFMRNHFNVIVPDATLDRAIYLGDHKVRISFGEVFQTSQGDGSASSGKLGDYAGRGAAYSGDGFIFDEKFLEHGQLYVIATIVPRAKYFQGIDRKFFIKDRFDFFFPEFQNIGDDALFTAELYNDGHFGDGTAASAYTDIMAYAPRWSHLKESLDEVHGDFLNNMDNYHFGRRFSSKPLLGEKFVQIPTINDPFSVTDAFSENYLINMRWNVNAARPVQLYEVF